MRPLADWTVLVYSSASADIVGVAQRALDDIGQAGHSPDVQVAAQLGTPQGLYRYHFLPGAGDAPDIHMSPAGDMSDPATLTEFLRWGQQQYPARRYLVVLGGHGSGFMGAITNAERGRVMAPQDMVAAIGQSGMHPDVVALNACLMAQMEVALPFSDVTSWLVASQAEEHGEGMDLGAVVSHLAGSTDAATLCTRQAAAPAPRVRALSALNLTALKNTATALDGLGEAILRHPETAPALRQILARLPMYREGEPWDVPLTELKDVGEFARSIGPGPLAAAAGRVVESLAQAVPVSINQSSDAHLGGVSTWLPTGDPDKVLGPDWGPRVKNQYQNLMERFAPQWARAVSQVLAVTAGA